MRLPITLDYKGDVEIFDDLREAESFLEPDDVEAGYVTVYDADGCRLRAVIVRKGLARRITLEQTMRNLLSRISFETF